MGGSNPELIVASVALVISFVALTATFMQVLQQYYASASGYSQCNREVMGVWAKSKSRRFSWEELRFVVQFDTPVIFISPPNNRKGPLTGPDIFFLDGTAQSREKTGIPEDRREGRTSEDRDETEALSDLGALSPKDGKETESKERVQTANHERASWLVLLDAVHRMEAESCEWQTEQYNAHGPPNRVSEEHGLPHHPPTLQGSHTLTVALQRKRKSWDTMPASVSRPYAITTICHLIETMAILGLYWKEFDRSRDRYRAEGNGYLVLGEKVSNLGLIFSLQRYGTNSFGRNRVIPLDEVKELCFGFVPTIYRKSSNKGGVDALANKLQDLESLQMATKSEIAETLVAIGCNKNSVQHFSNESGKTTHLFPMSFEIVGMLARTFHIDDTYFTFLPNPTPYRWDERALSFVKIMESYRTLSQVVPAAAARSAVIHRRLARHMESILRPHSDDGVEWLIFLKSLHAALADADEILTAKPSRGCVDISCHSQTDEGVHLQQYRREVVRDVLRSHIQEVLRLLNEREDRGFDTQAPLVAGGQPISPAGLRADVPRDTPTFEEINEASPDDRQDKFMQVYFEVIRPQVVRHAQESTNRRAAPANHGPRHRRGGLPVASAGTFATITDPEGAFSGGLREPSCPEGDETHVSRDGGVRDEHAEPTSLANEPASHDDIWDDIQMSKSELLGSRMPVYIA